MPTHEPANTPETDAQASLLLVFFPGVAAAALARAIWATQSSPLLTAAFTVLFVGAVAVFTIGLVMLVSDVRLLLDREL